ncbi:MAG: GntR family transcriptional regulator [Spirochaetia bacterium]
MEFEGTHSIYQQVADHVVEKILRKTWKEKERIPSVRELAVELEVNPNTVNKAYAQLQDQDLIHIQRGIGYFVSPGAVSAARKLKRREFVENDLPGLFKAMDLLNISLDELKELKGGMK